jgi:hypothetical protein
MNIKFKQKKNVISIIVFCLICTFLFCNYNADAHAQNIGCGIAVSDYDIVVEKTIRNNNSVSITYSDGATLTEYSDGEYLLSIQLSSPFFSDEERTYIINNGKQRSFIAMAKIFLEVVGGIFTTCAVIEWLSNYEFNPCQVARQYLGGNARTGRYAVEGNYIPGQVPGCEHMHSLPCNSGYYQYRFIPD